MGRVLLTFQDFVSFTDVRQPNPINRGMLIA